MRIIAGQLGGLNFDAPAGHRTHPMSEKARGGMFNLLGDISGLTVLDAFAGSGALSLEALSRGALSVVAIDVDKKAYVTLTKNIEKLGLKDKIKPIRANCGGWSENNPELQFDLVLVDPPYDNLQTALINKLTRHITTGGLLVLAWPGKQDVPLFSELRIVAQKNYGDAQLAFYKIAI